MPLKTSRAAAAFFAAAFIAASFKFFELKKLLKY
jgi:hypothetical protein